MSEWERREVVSCMSIRHKVEIKVVDFAHASSRAQRKMCKRSNPPRSNRELSWTNLDCQGSRIAGVRHCRPDVSCVWFGQTPLQSAGTRREGGRNKRGVDTGEPGTVSQVRLLLLDHLRVRYSTSKLSNASDALQ